MTSISFKREINDQVDPTIERLTEALKTEGFGILTRIDFHSKMKEKLGKDLRPLVILGACNPQLAYEAFVRNSDVTSLLPCNAVVRELDAARVSVELARPSALLEALGDPGLVTLAKDADLRLQRVLESL